MRRTLPLLLIVAGCTGRLSSSGRSDDGVVMVNFDAGVSRDGGQPAPQPDMAPPDATPDAGLTVDAALAPDAHPQIDAAPPAPDQGVPVDPSRDACGDVRQVSKVYNGTSEPTVVPLSAGQLLAVGSFNGCSGTLITPTWVLSATHCEHQRGAEFCVGEDAGNPNRCVSATAVFHNPDADQDLLELERPLTDVAPGVVPIPIMTERMDSSWQGRTAEAAGYGQTERGQFNVRWFTAEPIVAVSQPYLTIDGQGERGVCFGDSGGPVMVRATDNTVRVAGDLSHGDPSCLGQDNFTRTDLFVDWIESHTGPTVVDGGGPLPCGAVDGMGRCDGPTAEWCEGGELVREGCNTCGWDDWARGFRCIVGSDPCQGFDAEGACDGGRARWCDEGVLKTRDCDACGQQCAVTSGTGATCVDDPCAALDYQGQCDEDVAEWCDDSGYHSQDCGERGQSCGFVDDQIGYFCQ